MKTNTRILCVIKTLQIGLVAIKLIIEGKTFCKRKNFSEKAFTKIRHLKLPTIRPTLGALSKAEAQLQSEGNARLQLGVSPNLQKSFQSVSLLV